MSTNLKSWRRETHFNIQMISEMIEGAVSREDRRKLLFLNDEFNQMRTICSNNILTGER